MHFDLSKCIGFVTDTAIKTISEDFNKRLEKEGSTRTQWIALYFLYEAKNVISQKELAILMNVQDSSLARLVDRMERDELIRRVENTQDKRMKFLELTEKGRNRIELLLPLGQQFSDLLLNNVTDDELKTFECVINKMLNNIKK